MPRPGANANVVPLNPSHTRVRLTPINSLTRNERKIFNHTAITNPHLKPADVLLLEGFSMAVCRTVAAKRKNCQFWDTESRVMLAYATKLRLTPQSSVEPRTVARRRAELPPSYYDRMAQEENADDN
jgi:hypothetical protein